MARKRKMTRLQFLTLIGERLAAARTAKGYSFTDLANITGMSRGTLCDYEKGRGEAGSRVLRRLIRALDADANHILCTDVDAEEI